MVLPRIGTMVLCSFIFFGFRSPALPEAAQGVYYFGPQKLGGTVFRTLNGGVFSLTLGFKREIFHPITNGDLRGRAQYLLERVATSLAGYDEERNQIKIDVSRVYPAIREVVLTVTVGQVTHLDKVRTDLIALMSSTAGIAFVGNSGRARVE